MKILLVIPYYIPAYSYGGPVKVAHDLAKEFVKKGHQVTVVTTDVLDAQRRNKTKKEVIDGVEIIRFRNLSNYLAKNFNGYLPFGFRKWVQNNLKNYDIVHCHDFFTYQNIVISEYAKKYNIPFLVQPHGCLDEVRQKAKSSKLKTWFIKKFQILEKAKYIIALTEYEKESISSVIPAPTSVIPAQAGIQEPQSILQFTTTNSTETMDPRVKHKDDKNHTNKIKVIPNGIDLNEFKNIEKIDLHQKYNLPPETKLLFYFGRVQYIKGIDYVIKTLSVIPASNSVIPAQAGIQEPQSILQFTTTNSTETMDPSVKHEDDKTFNFHLFIIGPDEGGEEARLKKLVEEYGLKNNVTFTGQLNGEEKLRFISACDLFVFFSRGEGLPMTILEIAALGIPSMLSKECYVPEIAEGGGGYEVEKENFEQNAKIILKHFEDKEKIEAMSKNAKKIMEEKFGLDMVVEKMLKLYQERIKY